MPLPILTPISSKFNHEPIYINMYELFINNEILSQVIKGIDDKDNILEVSIDLDGFYFNNEAVTVKKIIREGSIDKLLGDTSNLYYDIVMSRFNKIGDVVIRKTYRGCEFLDGDSNKIKFSYITFIDESP